MDQAPSTMGDEIEEIFSSFGDSSRSKPANAPSTQPPEKRQRVGGAEESQNCVSSNANADTADEVVVEVYESDHNCVHECVRPKGDVPKRRSAGQPACTFPYSLDPFQSKAISCLECGESVLIAAHTSAGKTTVAEYAIAMGLRDKQRVIYTSPIKALSNQKYRDLAEAHGYEVGLLTGDVSLNPSASIVIMTTEILRSMLYRGSELIREMKWVIFDEIHYMRDRERGVVWEETIILLPDTIRLVFLSATLPNAREFAEWICRIKHQACHVIYTDTRPVPLQHYIFPAGGEGVHLVMDENKKFRENNFQRALAELSKTVDNPTEGALKGKQQGGKKSAKFDIEKIVLMCHERNYTPVIVFAFSKREVEANAMNLRKISLSNEKESRQIELIFNNAMDTLGEDKNLPQISCILPLLRRGIGLHHGGLLPVVKEIIEILFQEGLLKVLFSTETFSMGINMPAKTVVFTKLKKWDGETFRMISAGEYIQMSGRAGRRGLDDRGLCVLMLDEKLEPEVAKDLFSGEPLRLESQFHLSYNMLLNLLRVEGANPEYMIQRSFYQFQRDRASLQLQNKKKDLEKKLREMEEFDGDNVKSAFNGVDVNSAVANLYATRHDMESKEAELRSIVMRPGNVLRFLQRGRVVRVASPEGQDWSFGIVTDNARKVRAPNLGKRSVGGAPSSAQTADGEHVVPVLLKCYGNAENIPPQALRVLKPISSDPADPWHWNVVQVKLPCLRELTQVVANAPPGTLQTPEERGAWGEVFKKVWEKLNGDFPMLDPIEHMKIDDPRAKTILEELRNLEKICFENPVQRHPHFKSLLAKFHEKVMLRSELREIENKLESQKHLVMRDDLRAMRKVLRKLGYLDNKDVVTLKGRAACEVSSVDELVMCELLFQNVFHDTPNDYLVAMLSTMVFEEKAECAPSKDQRLQQAFERVREAATRVAEISVEYKLPLTVTDYVDKFKPVLMEIALKWMRGFRFSELGISDDLFEGSVVRAIRRLEELLRQLACAARSIGEQDLEKRLSEAIQTMRRGIIFSASLYL